MVLWSANASTIAGVGKCLALKSGGPLRRANISYGEPLLILVKLLGTREANKGGGHPICTMVSNVNIDEEESP